MPTSKTICFVSVVDGQLNAVRARVDEHTHTHTQYVVDAFRECEREKQHWVKT